MSIYSRRIGMSLPVVILIFFIALISLFFIASLTLSNKRLFDDEGMLWLFAVGAVPGFIVALAQFVLSWGEFVTVDRFRKIGVKNILLTRDDEVYYGDLIKKTKQTISVMGVTARRFMEDFGDIESPRAEKRILLAALERGVKVRILVADEAHLDEDTRDESYPKVRRYFESVKKKHASFQARYYGHIATQSLVQIDEHVIVGPVFCSVNSKHTPAIHLYRNSDLANSYLSNFEEEWDKAKSFDE